MDKIGVIRLVTYKENSLLLSLVVSNQLSYTQLNAIEETLATHKKPFVIEIISKANSNANCLLTLPVSNQLTDTQFNIINETLSTQTGPEPLIIKIWG